MPLKWKEIPYRRPFGGILPRASGVYLIADIDRVLGVPRELDFVYAGKSKDLRRRFYEHLNVRQEPNEGLIPIPGGSAWEFWYSELPLTEIASIEKQLIQGLPSSLAANKVRYKG
jgi:hypothetical protein